MLFNGIGGATTAYAAGSLEPATAYGFAVADLNGSGAASASNLVTVSTGGQFSPPSPPSNLAASAPAAPAHRRPEGIQIGGNPSPLPATRHNAATRPEGREGLCRLFRIRNGADRTWPKAAQVRVRRPCHVRVRGRLRRAHPLQNLGTIPHAFGLGYGWESTVTSTVSSPRRLHRKAGGKTRVQIS